MKKIILSFLTILSIATTAQTLTYANHAPAAGNPNFTTYQIDTTGVYPGVDGANQNWTFGASTSTIVTTYSTSNSVLATFSPANVVVDAGSNNTSYYLASSSDLKYYGGDVTVGGNAVIIKYTTPAIFALYPFSIGNSTTSITSGSVTLTSPFTITQAFTGTCIASASGTGTLSLPLKPFNDIIKVTTMQNLIAGGGSVSLNIISYDYYSISASKAPIFSIQTSTLSSSFGTTPQKIVTVQKDYNIVSVKENQRSEINLSVFPNPASNLINFTTSSIEAVKIIAFDVSGKIVASEILETGKAKMNTNNLTGGVYIYHVIGKNNEVLTSGKFNIAK